MGNIRYSLLTGIAIIQLTNINLLSNANVPRHVLFSLG